MLSLLKFNDSDPRIKVFHNFYKGADVSYFILLKTDQLDVEYNTISNKFSERVCSLDFNCAEVISETVEEILIESELVIDKLEMTIFIDFAGHFWNYHTKGFTVLVKHVYRVMDIETYLKSIFRKLKKQSLNCLLPQPYNSHFIIVESSEEENTRLFLKNRSLSEENIVLFLNRNQKSYCMFSTSNIELGMLQYLTEKPHRITAIIIFVAVLISIVYAFSGNNKFEDSFQLQTELIQERVRNLDLEEIEKYLGIELDQLFIPARNIDLEENWVYQTNSKITSRPIFDSRNIYMSLSSSVFVLNKRNQKPLWERTFIKKIIDQELLDFKRLLISFEDGTAIALERDTGITLWDTNVLCSNQVDRNFLPLQISLDMDRRLNSSLILCASKSRLEIKTILDGSTLTTYQATNDIDFVTEFDSYEKSVYIVKGKIITEVKLKIEN